MTARYLAAGIVMVLAVPGCGERSAASRDTFAVALPPIGPLPPIDTSLPSVFGVAVRLTEGEGQWCGVTSRRDLWRGRPVRIGFGFTAEFRDATIGDSLPSCPPIEPDPAIRFYRIDFRGVPGPLGWTPGFFLRDDVLGGGRRGDSKSTARLDASEPRETLDMCYTADSLILFITTDDREGNRTLRWRYALPGGADVQNCSGQAAAWFVRPRAPGPTMLVGWTHGDSHELPSDTTEWLVLQGDSTNADSVPPKLVVTDLRFERAPGACPETEDTAQFPFRRAVPAVRGDWLVLLKRIPGLRPGPVDEAQYERPSYTSDPDSIRLVFRADTMVLVRTRPEGVGPRITLHRRGGEAIAMFEPESEDEGRWGLVWAGDIDRDGTVDLLLDASRKYSVSAWHLYLSSRGARERSWQPFVSFSEAGC